MILIQFILLMIAGILIGRAIIDLLYP